MEREPKEVKRIKGMQDTALEIRSQEHMDRLVITGEVPLVPVFRYENGRKNALDK